MRLTTARLVTGRLIAVRFTRRVVATRLRTPTLTHSTATPSKGIEHLHLGHRRGLISRRFAAFDDPSRRIADGVQLGQSSRRHRRHIFRCIARNIRWRIARNIRRRIRRRILNRLRIGGGRRRCAFVRCIAEGVSGATHNRRLRCLHLPPLALFGDIPEAAHQVGELVQCRARDGQHVRHGFEPRLAVLVAQQVGQTFQHVDSDGAGTGGAIPGHGVISSRRIAVCRHCHQTGWRAFREFLQIVLQGP